MDNSDTSTAPGSTKDNLAATSTVAADTAPPLASETAEGAEAAASSASSSSSSTAADGAQSTEDQGGELIYSGSVSHSMTGVSFLSLFPC